MPPVMGKPSCSSPKMPPTFWNGMTRPVDPVSTSSVAGDPEPTEAFANASVPRAETTLASP